MSERLLLRLEEVPLHGPETKIPAGALREFPRHAELRQALVTESTRPALGLSVAGDAVAANYAWHAELNSEWSSAWRPTLADEVRRTAGVELDALRGELVLQASTCEARRSGEGERLGLTWTLKYSVGPRPAPVCWGWGSSFELRSLLEPAPSRFLLDATLVGLKQHEGAPWYADDCSADSLLGQWPLRRPDAGAAGGPPERAVRPPRASFPRSRSGASPRR